MDKRLVKLLQSGKIGGGKIYALDTYNQQAHEDFFCAIRTNINTANHHFIIEQMEHDHFGYGRRRGADGKVERRFLNEYTNSLHGQVGHARENMEVLVAESKDVIEVGKLSSSQNSRVIDPSGISYAVTNGHKDGEPKILQNAHGFNKGGEHIISPAITGSKFQDNNMVVGHSYRIRKLTPRECFRLMGVDDKDIDTIQASGVSNSQQYKMAGNSIVVDCLYHLFRKMFTETQSEDRQLTLF